MFGLGLYIYAGEDLPETLEIELTQQKVNALIKSNFAGVLRNDNKIEINGNIIETQKGISLIIPSNLKQVVEEAINKFNNQ